jgi:predicted lipid-binding transport protein (Tim44 family)
MGNDFGAIEPPTSFIERTPVTTTTKLIAACLALSLVGVPTLSFAKARGGSGGGFSNGSRTGGSGSMGSRGSRTYQQNSAKPIEQSTTAKPATPPPQTATPPSAVQSPPAAPASWWQRNPIMTGLMAGLAGSWIGHMIFGATDSSARTGEGGEQSGEPGQPANASGPNGMLLLLLMLMGGGVLYYVLKGRRQTAPAFSGISRAGTVSGSLLDSSSPTSFPADQGEIDITSADKAAFQQLLIDIQTAWGRQDLGGLRRLVTPEMLDYFSTALAEQASQDIANHVEDVTLLRAEVQEAWTEGTTHYATTLLHWSARDYTVSLTKPRGDSGYLIEGSDEQPTETTEVWTFVRHQNGKWLLSAIQQIA